MGHLQNQKRQPVRSCRLLLFAARSITSSATYTCQRRRQYARLLRDPLTGVQCFGHFLKGKELHTFDDFARGNGRCLLLFLGRDFLVVSIVLELRWYLRTIAFCSRSESVMSMAGVVVLLGGLRHSPQMNLSKRSQDRLSVSG